MHAVFRFVLVVVGMSVILFPLVAYADVPAWSWNQGASLYSKTAGTSSACDEQQRMFEVEGDGEQLVCFRGDDEIRLGMYPGPKGHLQQYAIALGDDKKLHKVEGCDIVNRCQYDPGHDLLITETFQSGTGTAPLRIYKHVAERFIRQQDANGATAYRFNESQPDYEFQWSDGSPREVGTVQLSANGERLVVILSQGQLAVLSLDTFEMVQVTTRTDYPAIGFAVSNDGKWLAVAGDASPFVIELTKECGRVLDGGVATAGPRVSLCGALYLQPGHFVEDIVSTISPSFSDDGGLLSMSLLDSHGMTTRLSVKANGYGITPVDYLALGDSFSSGEGETSDGYYIEGTNTASEKCHTSQRSYPFLLVLQQPMTVKSVACSGARTTDIIGDETYKGQSGRLSLLSDGQLHEAQSQALQIFRPGEIRQSDFVEHYKPTVITVGIGGNDSGLMSKLQACVMPDTCDWATDKTSRQKTAVEIRSQYDKLVTMYEQLHEKSPGSYIYAVGYPKVTDPDGRCSLLTGTLLDYDERVFANESIHYINQIIKAAAHATGTRYIDIENSLGEHTMCGSDTPAVNEFRFGDDIAPVSSLSWVKVFANETFHPTPLGHQLIAQAMNAQLAEFVHSDGCEHIGCYAHDSLDAPDYWGVAATTSSLPLQTIGTFVTSVIASFTHPIVHIQLYEASLQPGSQVQVEIHSKPESLGEYTVGSDGSLNQTITLPANLTPGVHTIHIYGISPSGEPIDLYQTINYDPDAPANVVLSHLDTSSSTPVSGSFQLTHLEKTSVRTVQPAPPVLAVAAQVNDMGVKGSAIVRSGLEALNANKPQAVMLACIALVGGVLCLFLGMYYRRKKGG